MAPPAVKNTILLFLFWISSAQTLPDGLFQTLKRLNVGDLVTTLAPILACAKEVFPHQPPTYNLFGKLNSFLKSSTSCFCSGVASSLAHTLTYLSFSSDKFIPRVATNFSL